MSLQYQYSGMSLVSKSLLVSCSNLRIKDIAVLVLQVHVYIFRTYLKDIAFAWPNTLTTLKCTLSAILTCTSIFGHRHCVQLLILSQLEDNSYVHAVHNTGKAVFIAADIPYQFVIVWYRPRSSTLSG